MNGLKLLRIMNHYHFDFTATAIRYTLCLYIVIWTCQPLHRCCFIWKNITHDLMPFPRVLPFVEYVVSSWDAIAWKQVLVKCVWLVWSIPAISMTKICSSNKNPLCGTHFSTQTHVPDTNSGCILFAIMKQAFLSDHNVPSTQPADVIKTNVFWEKAKASCTLKIQFVSLVTVIYRE